MANLKKINRREFLGSAAAASLAFTTIYFFWFFHCIVNFNSGDLKDSSLCSE